MRFGPARNQLGPLLAMALVMLGIFRVIAQYPIYNHTFDEPAHILCGLEWFEAGEYKLEALHPPLARIFVALGPFLSGARVPDLDGADIFVAGSEVLYGSRDYWTTLTLARVGVLPFFVLACFVTWIWTARIGGPVAALAAVLVLVHAPPVLAHAGLATTDMALAGTLGLALFLFCRWLEEPTLIRSLALGFTTALACASKLSALVFLPAASVSIASMAIALQRGRFRRSEQGMIARRAMTALGVAALTMWAIYRFDVGPIAEVGERPHAALDRIVGQHPTLQSIAYRIAEAPIVPASELWRGVNALRMKNEAGHAPYFLGERREDGGSWYFFPVALAVKTPLALLLLAVIGLYMLTHRGLTSRAVVIVAPALAALSILIVAMSSDINIGVRHILPVFPLLAIAAGFASAELYRWKTPYGAAFVILLLGCTVWEATSAHPRYLSYFNVAARQHSEELLVDSDLDWGQDLVSAGKLLREMGAEQVELAYFGTADPDRSGFVGASKLLPHQQAVGWVAISVTLLKNAEGYSWLEDYVPVATVGDSIRIYRIEPGRGARGAS